MTGAAAVATLRGGAEVVLDALPAGGVEVVIDLPVRAAGERGASAVEVRSSGGHLVSPGAGARAGGGALPGCGCGGAAGAEGLLALALLALRRRRRAYMKPMRRVDASTRSTSSSTRITRQACRNASASRSGSSHRRRRSSTDLVPSARASRWASLGRRPSA